MTTASSESLSGITSLNFNEVEAVSGGGFFDWFSHVTADWRIVVFGIELSDGMCNEHDSAHKD